jgi:beta-aspartyl-peptidase (threonine type)
MVRKVILVHGGAWAIPEIEETPHLLGVRQAVQGGWKILSCGGSALDAVSEAVRLMEGDPAFNAGRGATLNLEGEVTLDAAIMDGQTLAAGAVASVRGIEHPIDVARRVMERSPHVLLVGSGAVSFAREQGILTCAPSDLVVGRERLRWEEARRKRIPTGSTSHFEAPIGDTVGAVACDEEGHLAAATSTGGCLLKLPGRVGDSPLVGCGLYADDQLGAAASTGWGEGIIRVVLAHRAVSTLVQDKSASEAARESIDVLESRTGGRGGIILIDRCGNPGFHFNTPRMAYALIKEGMAEPEVGI